MNEVNEMWWNKICDCMARLEHNMFHPKHIWMDTRILMCLYEDLGKDFFNTKDVLWAKNKIVLTHLCGMEIHHEADVTKYRITSDIMPSGVIYNNSTEPIK